MWCLASSLKRSRVGAPRLRRTRTPRAYPATARSDQRTGGVETAERTIAWCAVVRMRIANSVEHCEMMVASSSAGRCVMSPRNTPYLRPSLAMRDTALRSGQSRSNDRRCVAMRFLADDEQRKRAVAPQAQLEGHAQQHGRDRVDTSAKPELHDGHPARRSRQAEQNAERLDHRVAADMALSNISRSAILRAVSMRVMRR